MTDGFEMWAWWLGAALVVGVVSVAVQALWARRRWGTVPAGSEPVGEGAYRSGNVARRERRLVPAQVVTAGIVSTVWAAITLLLFVPAGTVLASATAEQGYALVVLLMAVLVLSGVGVSIALLHAGSRLVRHHPSARETTRFVMRFNTAHHLAVWIGFSIVAKVVDPGSALWPTILGLGIPCGIGLMVSALLREAAATVAAVQADQSLEASSLEASSLEVSGAPASTGSSSSGRTKLVSS